MVEFPSSKPAVLVVEDDFPSRSFLESSLELSGFSVLSAGSAEEARKLCGEAGVASLSAVLSDYQLPGESGIGFLTWVRSVDPAVSTLIVTGQGETEAVRQSITAGVFQYLEKPLTQQELRDTLRKAVEETRIRRRFFSDRRELQQLEHLGQQLEFVIPPQLQSRMRVLHRPLHEVGGDFLAVHDFGADRWVLLVGDVSGHDLRSGFVSMYFQGLFRGCIESGGAVPGALQLFNRSLRQQAQQAAPQGELVSLAVAALEFSASRESLHYWNFGLTPCTLVSRHGGIEECAFGRFPLGWVDDISTTPHAIAIANHDLLYVFTDGLSELANRMEINSFSLLYRLMRSTYRVEDLPLAPLDDILAVCYRLNPDMSLDQLFEPILSEHYAGTEIEHIDHLQSNWRRSLAFALDDRLGDRLYDLLICIREGMLNALQHGCQRSPDKFAHLQISVNDRENILRVHIDDPGKGHSFNLQERLDKIHKETGQHLGLGIVQHLSDRFKIENKGTSLVFDFNMTVDNP